jgi:hypothetical protein
MINKRTLFARISLVGALALGLPAFGQYSTPMRDINDPGRTPFQLMSEFNTVLPSRNNPISLTSLPAGASQRLVVDYIEIEANNLDGTAATQGFAGIEVRDSTNLSTYTFHIILPFTVINTGSYSLALLAQPVRLYLSAGQTLTCTVVNLSGTSNMNVGVSVTGHYVTLP